MQLNSLLSERPRLVSPGEASFRFLIDELKYFCFVLNDVLIRCRSILVALPIHKTER